MTRERLEKECKADIICNRTALSRSWTQKWLWHAYPKRSPWWQHVLLSLCYLFPPLCWNEFVVTKYGSRSKKRKFLILLVWLSAENSKLFSIWTAWWVKLQYLNPIMIHQLMTLCVDSLSGGWKERGAHLRSPVFLHKPYVYW